jgi:hypothetical protein
VGRLKRPNNLPMDPCRDLERINRVNYMESTSPSKDRIASLDVCCRDPRVYRSVSCAAVWARLKTYRLRDNGVFSHLKIFHHTSMDCASKIQNAHIHVLWKTQRRIPSPMWTWIYSISMGNACASKNTPSHPYTPKTQRDVPGYPTWT